MTRDPVNMLMHAIFPNYFDGDGQYIGGPLTKAEEQNLREKLTEELGKEEADKEIKSMKKVIKEEQEMTTNMICKREKEAFSLSIGRDVLTVKKVFKPKTDTKAFWLNNIKCFEEVESTFVALKTFTNKEGKSVTIAIGEIDPSKDWTLQLTSLWNDDYKKRQAARAASKK